MITALVGPTASGKSQIALEAVRAVRTRTGSGPEEVVGDIELLSVDSMAVYRGMDIGTAKPSPEVRAEVRYHLVDLVDPSEEFTVTQFQQAAREAMVEIADRGNHAILVGGTGLYLRSVIDDLEFPGRYLDVARGLRAELDACGVEGTDQRAQGSAVLHARLKSLDPVAAGRIEPGNERRLVRALEVTVGSGRQFSSYGPGLERYPPTAISLVGVVPDPGQMDQRIADRFAIWMDDGFLEEVRNLAGQPGGLGRTARQALGYRELLSHLEGGVPLAEAVDEAVRRTRQFARRQLAWFRRDPRIAWVEPDADPLAAVMASLAADEGPPEPTARPAADPNR
ncbi:MAG: tRNA (adenosine(37)-N6)-dimethylallyltransferase MiaA [Acidimicrobiales bacterium]